MTTRRTFLRTAMLGAAAGTAARFGRGIALEAGQTTRATGATPAIIDWHAHWVGPRVVELLAARPSPRRWRATAATVRPNDARPIAPISA